MILNKSGYFPNLRPKKLVDEINFYLKGLRTDIEEPTITNGSSNNNNNNVNMVKELNSLALEPIKNSNKNDTGLYARDPPSKVAKTSQVNLLRTNINELRNSMEKDRETSENIGVRSFSDTRFFFFFPFFFQKNFFRKIQKFFHIFFFF